MSTDTSELGLEAYAEAVYPRFHFGWSDLRTLRAGRYKYIEAPRPELYDLQNDPGEQQNRIADRDALASLLQRALPALPDVVQSSRFSAALIATISIASSMQVWRSNGDRSS